MKKIHVKIFFVIFLIVFLSETNRNIIAKTKSDIQISTNQLIANKLERRVLSFTFGRFTISYSPNGKKLFYFGTSKISTCDGETGEEIASVKYTTEFTRGIPSFSPDGKILAIDKDYEQGIRLVDVRTGSLIGKLGKNSDFDKTLFSPDGKTLAIGFRGEGYDRLINLWNIESKQKTRTIELGYALNPCIFLFSPDGKTLASAKFGHDDLKIWNLEKREDVKTKEDIRDIKALCFSPDGKTLAVSGDKGIEFLDVGTWEKIGIIENTKPNEISFSPDGKILACLYRTSGNYRIILRHVETGVIFGRMYHDEYLHSVKFIPSGKTIATAGSEAIIWNPGYYLSIISSNLDPRKGELETSGEFLKRTQRAKKEFELKKEEARKYLTSRLFPIRIIASLGVYSADSGSFIIKFLDKEAQIKVPRDKAVQLIESRNSKPSFYQKHKPNYYIDAKIKMVNDRTFSLVNAYFVDPSIDIKIPFGKFE